MRETGRKAESPTFRHDFETKKFSVGYLKDLLENWYGVLGNY